MTVHWRELDRTGRIEAIRSAWKPGSSAQLISEALGVSRNTVAGMYDRYREQLADTPLSGKSGGFRAGSGRRRWTDADRELVSQMMRDHKSCDAIAKAIGGRVTGNMVLSFVRRTPELTAIGWSAREHLTPEERKERQLAAGRRYRAKMRGAPKASQPQVPLRKPFVPYVVSNNIGLMVQDFIAKNGVRKFERGASADNLMLSAYLAERGYRLTKRASCYTLGKENRPARIVSWKQVIALVDKFRRADGLEPFLAA